MRRSGAGAARRVGFRGVGRIIPPVTTVPAYNPTWASAWWRPDDSKDASAAAATNGVKVATCANRLAPGTYDLAQTTDALRFTYVASGMASLPAWSIASGNYMSADALAALFTGEDKPVTLFIVARHLTDANTESCMVGMGNTGTSNPFIAMKYRSDAANRQAEYQHRDSAATLVTRQSSGVFATGDFLYEFYVDPAAMSILINGVSVSGPHDNATTLGTTALNTFSVGALRRNTVVFPSSSIEISDVLVGNSAASAGNRAAHRAYVTGRYPSIVI